MTSITIHFKGVQEKILDNMIASGIANTKSEAIRMALLDFAMDLGMLEKRKLLAELRSELAGAKISEPELEALIQDAKRESVHR